MQAKEAAERLGISQRMLRHYEKEGLLQVNRTSNGYRTYSETDLRRAARPHPASVSCRLHMLCSSTTLPISIVTICPSSTTTFPCTTVHLAVCGPQKTIAARRSCSAPA